MAYVKIREEICPQVYEVILAIANPETGVAQVKAGEILAMMNCRRYDERQISKAINYLVEDKKIEFISDNGMNGIKVRVPELCRGNTVVIKEYKPIPGCPDSGSVSFELHKSPPRKDPTVKDPNLLYPHPKDSLVEIEKERMGLKKVEEAKVEEVAKPPAPPLEQALTNAEFVLSDSADIVAKVLSEYMRTRKALDTLVKAVKQHGGA